MQIYFSLDVILQNILYIQHIIDFIYEHGLPVYVFANLGCYRYWGPIQQGGTPRTRVYNIQDAAARPPAMLSREQWDGDLPLYTRHILFTDDRTRTIRNTDYHALLRKVKLAFQVHESGGFFTLFMSFVVVEQVLVAGIKMLLGHDGTTG